MTGAEVRFDGDFNEPYVALNFNSVGAMIFHEVTRENIRKRLAIVLDDNVYSAPVIQDAIPGGRAQIPDSLPQKMHGIWQSYYVQARYLLPL